MRRHAFMMLIIAILPVVSRANVTSFHTWNKIWGESFWDEHIDNEPVSSYRSKKVPLAPGYPPTVTIYVGSRAGYGTFLDNTFHIKASSDGTDEVQSRAGSQIIWNFVAQTHTMDIHFVGRHEGWSFPLTTPFIPPYSPPWKGNHVSYSLVGPGIEAEKQFVELQPSHASNPFSETVSFNLAIGGAYTFTMTSYNYSGNLYASCFLDATIVGQDIKAKPIPTPSALLLLGLGSGLVGLMQRRTQL